MTFNKLVLFLLVSFFVNLSNAETCDTLKKTILTNNHPDELTLSILKKGVESEDPCTQNLMGVMIYNGIYFEKNIDRAEAIFFDLANKNYPESQYNFALSMTKRLDQNPTDVISLITGVFIKYADDKSLNHLSSLARDLGYKYTAGLEDFMKVCTKAGDKHLTCSKYMKELSLDEISRISSIYQESIREAQFKVANERLRLSKNSKETMDTIFSILSVGAMAYSLSAPQSFSDGNSLGSSQNSNPWFNYNQGFGNPLGLYQFQLH